LVGNPIHELQTDLKDIGYSVSVDGYFGVKTRMAVQMFQEHFFSEPRRGGGANGHVNRATAERIKSVRP